MFPKIHPQNERDLFGHPTLAHKKGLEPLEKLGHRLLLNQLLTLARVVIDLVEQQETAGDPVWLDEAQIVALVLRDYGVRTLPGLTVHRATLSQEGIELDFQTLLQDQEVSWSLKLTRHSPGSSEAKPC